MRRIAIVVLGLSLACLALPESASARPRGLPGLFGVITKPLGMLLGNPARMSRQANPRRSTVARTRQRGPATAETTRAAPAATTSQAAPAAMAAAPVAGAAGVAAVAATANAAPTPEPVPLPVAAPPQREAPVAAEAAPAPVSTPTSTPAPAQRTVATEAATTPPPAPAPAQRTAATPAAEAATPSPAPTPAPAPRTAAPAGEAAPAPAAPQRSAALSQPTEQQLQPQPRSRQAARTSRATERAAPAREPSQLGMVGPQTWPNAYEDILGYTLWPDKYGEKVKAHGIGDVMSVIFAPQSLAAAGGHAMVRSADANPSDADAATTACTMAAQSADWPARQIEQSLELTEPQRAALAQLRTAVAEGVGAIKAICRDNTHTSADRLRAMQHTLWAVRDATILVRTPLVNFYNSLSAEQKKQFIAQPSQADQRMAQMDPRAMSRGQQSIPPQLARMCGMAGANEWPMRQIEHSIRPNRAQRASLEALQKKSGEMGQLLMASCLQATPASPDLRIDAALDRLTALLFAVSNVGLAFNDFYGQLSDEQKSQLGSFGL